MKFSLEQKLVAGLAAALLPLLAFGAIAWANARQFASTLQLVDHTHRVLYQLESTLNHVVGAQTEAQRFLLIQDEDCLTRRAAHERALASGLAELQGLTADNPVQRERLARLPALVAEMTRLSDLRVALAREQGFEAARQRVALGEVRRVVDHIRAITAAAESTERELLRVRLEESRRATATTLAWIGLGSLAAALLTVGGAWKMWHDLRARERAESALRASEERFRRMIDSIDYSILLLDPQGRVVSCNPGAERLTGYTAAEMIGEPLARFHPPESVRGGLPGRELQEAEAGGHYEDEGWRVHKDGSRFWASVTISVVRGADGRLLGFVKVTRDHSRRRESEEQIRRLNADLRLQNSRLEAANQELEAFSYSVSHDLRAPLRHIDGFASLLTKHAGEALDEKGRRYVQVISDAARKMGRLIDDLLAFSRTGRAQLKPGVIDSNELVADVIRENAFARDPRIVWTIPRLPPAHADPGLLRQVWFNLIDNAVKYSSRADQPRIAIGGEETGGEAVFHVRDNGVGFDMQYAAKLFGVFQRLHAESEFEGTGIGLANVRRIVTRHGGRTWAEGRVGEGATFSFSLPVSTTSL